MRNWRTVTKLILYVCGNSASSRRAIENANAIFSALDEQPELEIVDIIQHPDRAEKARILATPSLVREDPLPLRILVGDLSNVDLVRSALNLPNHKGYR